MKGVVLLVNDSDFYLGKEVVIVTEDRGTKMVKLDSYDGRYYEGIEVSSKNLKIKFESHQIKKVVLEELTNKKKYPLKFSQVRKAVEKDLGKEVFFKVVKNQPITFADKESELVKGLHSKNFSYPEDYEEARVVPGSKRIYSLEDIQEVLGLETTIEFLNGKT